MKLFTLAAVSLTLTFPRFIFMFFNYIQVRAMETRGIGWPLEPELQALVSCWEPTLVICKKSTNV